MKKKTFGFFVSMLTAVLAVIALVVTLIYKGRGGAVSTQALIALIAAVLFELAAFSGEKPWTDFTSILGAVALTFGFITVLGDGIWNIAESINGIKMVGLPELALMNYLMAGIELVGILTAIVACFTRKSKD